MFEDIENHYSRDDNWFGSFDCPNCNQSWGPSNQGDPPGTTVDYVKCTCGEILRVRGEWVSTYEIDVEKMDL